MDAMDQKTLDWAADWILGQLSGETNERVKEFGQNMAMSIRAANYEIPEEEERLGTDLHDPRAKDVLHRFGY